MYCRKWNSIQNPLIILPRKTIEQEVQLQGYNDEKALFRYQEHAFMTMKLFE
jgi:hypothetical protein